MMHVPATIFATRISKPLSSSGFFAFAPIHKIAVSLPRRFTTYTALPSSST